eukprot:m.220411 g.220411  ORF g.220411 m.220411 type:complete len:221 (+) comp10377_c0_seq1:1475-2137(+)
MSDDLTLYVFAGVRGLAEKIRILLAETGLRYTEVPVDQATFEKMSTDGTLNWNTLPMLKHGSAIIEDSSTIMEYIADLADKLKKGSGGNLYGGKPEERPFVRAIANSATDFQKAVKIWEGKEKIDPAVVSDLIPKWFGLFQRVLDKNDDGDVRTEEWSYGKQFTYADVTVFEAVNAITEVLGSTKLRTFPKLKEFHDKIAGRARIDRHISTRPQQVFKTL